MYQKVICVVIVMTLCAPTFAQTRNVNIAAEKMTRYWAQFQQLRSIHCQARKTTTGLLTPSFISHGRFEYWADGERYHIVELSDLPGMSNDLRWDGETLQWQKETDLVITKRHTGSMQWASQRTVGAPNGLF